MRILIVSNIFPPEVLGGYEIECAQVADALCKRGHEILVLTSGKENNKTPDAVAYNIQRTLKLCLPFGKEITSAMRWRKWITGLHNTHETRKAIANFKPDVLYFWSPLRLGIGPARAAVKEKLPIVWRFGDESIAGYMPKGSKKSFKEIYRYLCDHIFFSSATLIGVPLNHSSCISHMTKKRLIERGLPLEKSQVIYKSIPLELFPLKQGAGNYTSPLRLLYVGLLDPVKGVHTLVKACKKLHEQGVSATLTVVGRGSEDYTKQLKQLSDGGMPTTFLGYVHYSDMPKIYQQHDVLVFPSEWIEPQGTTFLEAMSSGIAVVATSTGGQGEILQNDVNALIFEAGDVNSLCAALMRLINDKMLYQSLITKARDYVEKKFSFDMFIDKQEALLMNARVNP